MPRGIILFAPDYALGNNGPGTRAVIQDGRYQTAPGKGTIGGPHIAIIDGFDGIRPHQKTAGTHESGREKIAALGQPLFRSIHVKIDLPRQAATHDFVLPVE